MTGGPERRLREFERTIESLRGVRGARVVGGERGVENIRVLVIPERDPADTVRAVQALALSHLDQPVERSRVQVLAAARLEVDGRGRRRKLASLVTERTDRDFTVRVMLQLGADSMIGEARSPLVRRFECRAVAEAVLHGLAEIIDSPVHLETVDLTSVGETRAAVVALSRGPHPVVGSALVTFDDHDAIARATLDALNRFL